MITEVRILTKKGAQHHESLLIIDWTGVSEHDMQVLAQWAIIHNTQAKIVKDGSDFYSDRILIKAAEMVKESAPLILAKYTPPPPKLVKFESALEKALDGMTEEERQQLMALLT